MSKHQALVEPRKSSPRRTLSFGLGVLFLVIAWATFTPEPQWISAVASFGAVLCFFDFFSLSGGAKKHRNGGTKATQGMLTFGDLKRAMDQRRQPKGEKEEELSRVARLLVTELKLYHEEMVLKGRRSHRVYVLLQEEIDRSYEVYRKQAPDDAPDYFLQELIDRLGEGNISVFGLGDPP